MVDVKSRPITNLIQGISQQSAQQRRESQCEDQQNCLNSVVDGAVARPGTNVLTKHSSLDLQDSFFYEIKRSSEEHYLVAIQDGSIKAFNLSSGVEATIATPDGLGYLALPSGFKASKNFMAATAEDFTFLGNKSIYPAIDNSVVSDPAVNEGLLYFKAGAYKTTYSLRVTHDGTIYKFTYQTPGNGSTENSAYITTNHLAATFYRAVTGSSGTGAVNDGATVPGDAGTVSDGTLTSNGFSVQISGSTIRIWRTDTEDFTLESSDGLGETQMIVIKSGVRKFSDLPEHCFPDVTIKVRGEDREDEDDYWVTYEGDSNSTGQWVETVAPSTNLNLDNTTMPYILINDGLNSFILQKSSWGARVVGDGVSSSIDPSFIGKVIEDLVFYGGRLGILTVGSTVFSRSKNVYVFFPDTVQTTLDTAPIDSESFNGKPSLLRRFVTAGEGLFLWAEDTQLVVTSGDENLKESTIEIKPSTDFEYSNDVPPLSLGLGSIFFPTKPGDNTAIRELFIKRGRPEGETDLTEHVPRLIASPIRQLAGSDTSRVLAVVNDVDTQKVDIYQWLVQGTDRVQSSWNYWTFPQVDHVLWVGFKNATMFFLMQRGTDVTIETLTLSSQPRDPGGSYYTRMDHRFDETGGSWVEDSGGIGTYTVALPYDLPTDTDYSKFIVASRTQGSSGEPLRGELLSFDVGTPGELKILDVPSDVEFYAGFTITSFREESEFYVRDDQGIVPTDSIRIRAFKVLHARTGYYRIEVVLPDGSVKSEEYNGRVLGDPGILNEDVAISDGDFKKNVDKKTGTFTLRIINDSIYPSAWQSAVYTYVPTVRSG